MQCVQVPNFSNECITKVGIPGHHPCCPPGQVIGILPESFVRGPDFPRPLNKPTAKRPSKHPWTQCVETHIVNDQVRRPLARWTHCRPVPPLLLPQCELQRMQCTIGSHDRQRLECKALAAAQEQERQASYARHGCMNWNIDTLLECKRREEALKEQSFIEQDHRTKNSVRETRDKLSYDGYIDSKTKLLQQNGLLRDFHAAMAASKQLAKNEELKRIRARRCQDQMRAQQVSAEGDSSAPVSHWATICNEATSTPNSPGSAKAGDACASHICGFQGKLMGKKLEVHNQELQMAFGEYQERRRQHATALQKAKLDLQKTREETANEFAEIEHQMDPTGTCPLKTQVVPQPNCESEDQDQKKQQQQVLKAQILKDIQDKLDAHAFIQHQEYEVDRQACEFQAYKHKFNQIRKMQEDKEKNDTVACRIANSELVAKLVAETEKKKDQVLKIGGKYDELRKTWQAEYEAKWKNSFAEHQKKIDAATMDLCNRVDIGCCKRLQMDPVWEWKAQQTTADQDYHMKCVADDTKKQKAKELQEVHRCQMAEKAWKAELARGDNAIWGEKARMKNACEMTAMKEYANKKIQEWQKKGRSIVPLKKALKKWDYDGGMTPALWHGMYYGLAPTGNCDPQQNIDCSQVYEAQKLC